MDFDFEKESKKPLLMKIFIEVFIWAAEIAAVIFLAYFIVYYALNVPIWWGFPWRIP
jgi:signal peptidase I